MMDELNAPPRVGDRVKLMEKRDTSQRVGDRVKLSQRMRGANGKVQAVTPDGKTVTIGGKDYVLADCTSITVVRAPAAEVDDLLALFRAAEKSHFDATGDLGRSVVAGLRAIDQAARADEREKQVTLLVPVTPPADDDDGGDDEQFCAVCLAGTTSGDHLGSLCGEGDL